MSKLYLQNYDTDLLLSVCQTYAVKVAETLQLRVLSRAMMQRHMRNILDLQELWRGSTQILGKSSRIQVGLFKWNLSFFRQKNYNFNCSCLILDVLKNTLWTQCYILRQITYIGNPQQVTWLIIFLFFRWESGQDMGWSLS